MRRMVRAPRAEVREVVTAVLHLSPMQVQRVPVARVLAYCCGSSLHSSSSESAQSRTITRWPSA